MGKIAPIGLTQEHGEEASVPREEGRESGAPQTQLVRRGMCRIATRFAATSAGGAGPDGVAVRLGPLKRDE